MIAIQNNNSARLPAHLTVPRGLQVDCRPTMDYYTLDEIERPLPTVEDGYVDDDQVDMFIGLVSLNSKKSKPFIKIKNNVHTLKQKGKSTKSKTNNKSKKHKTTNRKSKK
jgi:hypothetical protein